MCPSCRRRGRPLAPALSAGRAHSLGTIAGESAGGRKSARHPHHGGYPTTLACVAKFFTSKALEQEAAKQDT